MASPSPSRKAKGASSSHRALAPSTGMGRNIGIIVRGPEKRCDDRHCPFHGGFSVRGRQFVGMVIKDPFHKTITVEFPRLHYLHKYERYERRRSRITCHVPGCFEVKKGMRVAIMETRPISKTKNFVVVDVLSQAAEQPGLAPAAQGGGA